MVEIHSNYYEHKDENSSLPRQKRKRTFGASIVRLAIWTLRKIKQKDSFSDKEDVSTPLIGIVEEMPWRKD